MLGKSPAWAILVIRRSNMTLKFAMNPKIYLLMIMIGVLLAAVNLSAPFQGAGPATAANKGLRGRRKDRLSGRNHFQSSRFFVRKRWRLQ